MTKIFLIRHGETGSNSQKRYMGWIDEGLNSNGLNQAYAVAKRLENIKIAAIYSSPLKRAIETITPLANKLGLKVTPVDGLGEMRMGPWEGLNEEQIKTQYPEEWMIWRASPHKLLIQGREDLNSMQVRVVRATQKICEIHRNDEIVFATHDAVIRVLIAYVIGSDTSIYRRIGVSNGSISIIRMRSDWAEIELLNDICHLDGTCHSGSILGIKN